MTDMLSCEAVSKSFGDVQALHAVDFSIPQGSIFGLLGPNGAGKTTLIRIITRIFAADSGRIMFDGRDIRDVAYTEIGYMPEEKGMYKKMRVGEHLVYLGRLKGLSAQVARERSRIWLEKLQAADWWNKKLEDLSKGMQQKVQFIATVLHEPKLLILDEPFSGLDPVNAEIIKNVINELHLQGTTIIFSTHRMEQVEEICDHIVLINKGRQILNGSVQEIRKTYKQHRYHIGFANKIEIPENTLFKVVTTADDHMIIQMTSEIQGNALLQFLMQEGMEITAMYELLPGINEIFIQLVNPELHA
jgi:ABC-2 type transport system ATP-binding protein